MLSMKLGRPESTIECSCAPPSLKPSKQAGSLGHFADRLVVARHVIHHRKYKY